MVVAQGFLFAGRVPSFSLILSGFWVVSINSLPPWATCKGGQAHHRALFGGFGLRFPQGSGFLDLNELPLVICVRTDRQRHTHTHTQTESLSVYAGRWGRAMNCNSLHSFTIRGPLKPFALDPLKAWPYTWAWRCDSRRKRTWPSTTRMGKFAWKRSSEALPQNAQRLRPDTRGGTYTAKRGSKLYARHGFCRCGSPH